MSSELTDYILGLNGERLDVRSYPSAVIREARVIERSPNEVPKTNAPPDTTSDDHARALLRLHSARRLLRTYRLGLLGLLSSAITFACMGMGGIATAVGSSMLDYDASGIVVGLECAGWPGLVLSVLGLFVWQSHYRIETRYAKSSYGGSTPIVESINYVDPQLNLEIRQLEYARALEALAHAGNTP